MEIKTQITKTIVTTAGSDLTVGDLVVFNSGGKPMFGTFKGITSKGSLEFEALGITFRVLPKSIDKMYLIEMAYRDLEE